MFAEAVYPLSIYGLGAAEILITTSFLFIVYHFNMALAITTADAELVWSRLPVTTSAVLYFVPSL